MGQVPVIYLRLKLTDLQELLRFIYLGYCEVEQVRVQDFLDLARELELTGLSQEMEGQTKRHQRKEENLDTINNGSDGQFEHKEDTLKRETNGKRTEFGSPHSVDRNETEVGFTEFTESLAPRSEPWRNSWKELVDMNGERFGEYLKPCDDKNARCSRCNTVFKFSNGITALKRHSETFKHRANSKVDSEGRKSLVADKSGEFYNTGSVFEVLEKTDKELSEGKKERKNIQTQLGAIYPVVQHLQNNEVEMKATDHTENFTPSPSHRHNWQWSWENLLDLNGERYGEYLQPSGDKNAKCTRCDTVYNFSSSGITALKRHSQTMKHKANSKIEIEIDNSLLDDENFSIIKC